MCVKYSIPQYRSVDYDCDVVTNTTKIFLNSYSSTFSIFVSGFPKSDVNCTFFKFRREATFIFISPAPAPVRSMHCRGKMKHSGNFFWFLLLLIFEIFRFSSFRFLWCILRAGLVHIPPSRRWEENPRPRNPRFFNFLFLCGSWGLRELVQFWNRGWTRKENTFTRISIWDVHGNFSSFLTQILLLFSFLITFLVCTMMNEYSIELNQSYFELKFEFVGKLYSWMIF